MRPKLVILDCDGTLYLGNQPITEAVQAVKLLRKQGFSIKFVTNNSGITQLGLQKKLYKLGFNCVETEVLGTARATALAMKQMGLSSALIVGAESIKSEVELLDLKAEMAHDDEPREDKFDVVIAGICRTLSYPKIAQAMEAIRKGAKFMATNADAGYPLPNGVIAPGAGATVGAISAVSQTQPLIIGKPEPLMLNLILQETGFCSEETWVVGDRYETDILFGKSLGCNTFMVLTGVQKQAPEGQKSGESLLEFVKQLA